MKITLGSDKHFTISTRDRSIFQKFTYKKIVRIYNQRLHRYLNHEERVKMYKQLDKYTIRLSNGYIFYAINILKDKMDPDEVQKIIKHFKSDLQPFDPMILRPEDQIPDMNKLLKLKMGIFQCYTGYGKSEIIAVMVKNFVDQGKRVAIFLPNKAAVVEIRHRVQKYLPPISTFINNKAMVNICAPVALVDSNQWERLRQSDFKWFRSVDVVIADEVEMTINESFHRINRRMDNAQYFYGFSASANKNSIDPIPRDKSLRSVMNDQLNSMVKIYGFTAVYQLPKLNKLNIISLHTNLCGYRYVGVSNSNSAYQNVVTNLFSYSKFQQAVAFILSKVDNLYVPINNLSVIQGLVHSNITDKDIMTIQASGYHIYNQGRHIKDVSLETAKKYISEGRIHMVLGTSSSFRALDFRKLSNILCTFGKLTSVTIQYVGRVAREVNMNIWFIESAPEVRIYSRTINNNKRMIEDYYSNCDIDYQEEWI